MANFKKAHINFEGLPKVYNFIPNVILTAPVHEVEKEYVKDYFVAGEYNFIPDVILTAPVNESEKPYTSDFYADAENANFETAEHFNADFDTAQNAVKINEGGYQALSWDKGNYNQDGVLVGTNFGISAPTLDAYLGRASTVQDMKGLTYDTALQIYKKNYWDSLSLTSVSNPDLALLIYDGSVNQGQPFIKKIVADSLPSKTYNVAEINSANQKDLFDTVKQKRLDRYNSLGGKGLSSWLTRLDKLTFTDAVQSVKQGITNVSNAVLGTKATAAIKQNSKLALAVIIGASLLVGLAIVAIASKKSAAPATT